VAYSLTETGGVSHVFVQPFPASGVKYQVSKNLGHHPLWSTDGREILYDFSSGRSEIVSVATTPTFTFSNPAILPRGTMLFAGTTSLRPVDMAPDGRILGQIDADQDPSGALAAPQIRVVLNWTEELKQRVPVPNP